MANAEALEKEPEEKKINKKQYIKYKQKHSSDIEVFFFLSVVA